MANLRPLPGRANSISPATACAAESLSCTSTRPTRVCRKSRCKNPDGAHSIACGLDAELDVQIHGHVGYYVAGMNKHASVTVHGNAGPGAAENMMSGRVHVKGFASTAAGASAHGGLLVIDGDASLRCGISLKGADIVVGGSVGSFSAFMAQAGRIVICGDAEDALGDSLVRGGDLRARQGALARRRCALRTHDRHRSRRREAAARAAGLVHDPADFKRVASAKSLYHWHADADQEY
jgi:glutamate synthase domain-containing protein 3